MSFLSKIGEVITILINVIGNLLWLSYIVEVQVKRLFLLLCQFFPKSLFFISFVLLAACSGGGETTQTPAQAPAAVEATIPITESQPAAPTEAPQSNNEPAANQNSDEASSTMVVLTPVPNVEDVGYADRADWLQLLDTPASCEQDFQFIAGYYQEQNLSGITFYTVEPQKYVVEVLCATFAYSFHSRLYLYNAQTQSATPLILQDVTSDGALQDTDILFSSSFGFDHASNQFTNFQKGRGLGDCGTFYTYQFASDSLTLLEARYRECSETISEEDYVEPQEWDLIYP